MRSSPLRLAGSLGLAAVLFAALATTATARSIVARPDGAAAVRFTLPDVAASTVARTVVRTRGYRAVVGTTQLRRALRRHSLRVRVPAWVAARAARRQAGSPVRLVLVARASASGRRPRKRRDPAPPPTPAPTTDWRPVGSAPLSDADAAARVVPAAELRAENYGANHYWPSDAELSAFHVARYESAWYAGRLGDDVIPERRHITGRFAGTTDEILQWGAHKWGIPIDVMRAVASQESKWRQSAMGDRATVADSSLYPAQSRISPTEVYESLGLMQIKWRPDESLNAGAEPLRWKSTAFIVDYYGALIRYYYDGTAAPEYTSQPDYSAGQAWNSVGAWYLPWPWTNSDSARYIDQVQTLLSGRVWEQPGY